MWAQGGTWDMIAAATASVYIDLVRKPRVSPLTVLQLRGRRLQPILRRACCVGEGKRERTKVSPRAKAAWLDGAMSRATSTRAHWSTTRNCRWPAAACRARTSGETCAAASTLPLTRTAPSTLPACPASLISSSSSLKLKREEERRRITSIPTMPAATLRLRARHRRIHRGQRGDRR